MRVATERSKDDAPHSGAAVTQSFRQPITEHQIVFGCCRTAGRVVFLHSATGDEVRADGFRHLVVVLAAHRVRAISEVFLTGTTSTGAKPAIAAASICFRQVESWPVLTPCRSATACTITPGSSVSRTIRSRSSGDQFRRRTSRTGLLTP